MIATEEGLKDKLVYCYVCNKPLKVGQSYEKITTHSNNEIVVHTDCICGKGGDSEK
jgi:RNase P subunit RPR2